MSAGSSVLGRPQHPTTVGADQGVAVVVHQMMVAAAQQGECVDVGGPERRRSKGHEMVCLTVLRGRPAAHAATVAGGTGGNVALSDIELSWNTDHEDLADASGAELPNGTPFDPFGDNNHGTAVLGILAAENNGFGVTGVVPDAGLKLVNVYNSGTPALADAINLAAANSDPGDVLLIEQQLCPVSLVGGVCVPGWLPVEWYAPYYDAIVAAVARGVVVVEAAGNGARDIDAPLVLPDSGAIIVGAGNPSHTCNVLGNEPGRARLSFSNSATRVDLQAHRACVWTTGSEGFAVNPAASVNSRYTASFSGTSAAAAIVAGAAASVSSVAIGAGDPLTATEVRAVLRSTGTPQDTSLDPRPIGPLPNLRDAIAPYVGATPSPGNDDFFAPTLLSGVPAIVTQSTAGATVQAGEPVSSCGSPATTVWFNTTAPRDVDVTLTLQGSAGSPSLAAWHDTGAGTLEELDCSAGGPDVALTALRIQLLAGETYRIQVGSTAGQALTLTLAGAASCDLDADGFGDLIIGAPGETVRGAVAAGAINVFYGHPQNQPDSVPILSQASAGVAGKPQAGDRFGSSVACGDIDGDGYDDAVVGVPGERRRRNRDVGAIQIFYGTASGIGGARDELVSQASAAVPGRPEAGDLFGSSVAAGDVNGDGRADVVVGVPGEGLAGRPDAGMVAVLYGSPAGLDPNQAVSIHQNRPGVPGRRKPGPSFMLRN
ncbi:MAG: S8 family serine peptidase, partial [Acidimicrobiales bacterium]